MSRYYELSLYLLSTIIILNAILAVIIPVERYGTVNSVQTEKIGTTVLMNITSNKSCCSCGSPTSTKPIGSDNILWHRQVNYSEVAASFPSLSLEYRTTTLTRLGSDISFDLSTCPSDSAMLKAKENFTPVHLDCPTLFIVGARKAGTSSLYQYVSKHPDFEGTKLDSGPKVGETFYFSSHYKLKSWKTFLKYFPSDGVMTGESSVGNLVACDSPKHIFESCGKQAKVVMLFRNPIDRLTSNFLMRARLKLVHISNSTSIATVIKLHLDNFFRTILKRNIDVTRLPEQWASMTCVFDPAINLVYEGLYYVHLMNWLCNFPRENILIINSEEFYIKPSVILDQVVQFLGLKRLDNETYDWITSTIYNKGDYSIPEFQKVSRVDRKKLSAVYGPLNTALFSLLDWNTVNWD